MKHILLMLGAPCLGLTGCLSYSVALGDGWDNSPNGVARRIGIGAVDLVTLPVQAVAIPAILAVEDRKQARQRMESRDNSTRKEVQGSKPPRGGKKR